MSDLSHVESTLLGPTCTRGEAASAIERAAGLGCAAVCLSPTHFPLRGVPDGLRLVSVAGFPSGKHHPLVKASEAHMAVVNGAHEVHAVLDATNVVAGDLTAMISEIVTLREAVPYPAVLRVAPGDGAVELDEDQVRTFCRAAVTAGADMVAARGGPAHGGETGTMLSAVAGTAVTVAAPREATGMVPHGVARGVVRVLVPADELGDSPGQA